MLQQLFGAELDFSVRLAIALIVVAALLGVTVFVMRRLGGGLSGRAPGRGRNGPRLAVVDAVAIDPRRRLVLVRRDDVEHLLLTGGANDVVVEQNITGGYVATAGLRPAMPLEREAQRGVQPPTARAPLAPRPQAAQLTPATPQTDALAASMAAAALAAPATRRRSPYEAEAEAEAELDEPTPLARPEVAPRPAPQAPVRPAAPVAAVRAEAPALPAAPAVEESGNEQRDTSEGPAPTRVEALLANAARLRSQAATLRQRLVRLPADQKVEVAATIRRIDRKVADTLKEVERLTGESQKAEATPAAGPRLSDDAAKRGLALLLGTQRPETKTEAAENAPAPANTVADQAAQKAAAEKAAVERAAAQKAAAEKAAAEKAAAERAAAQKAAAEKAAVEKAAAERASAQKAAAEKAAAEKAAAERAAAQKAAAEKAAVEKAAVERAAAQKAAAEKAAVEKAAAEKAAAERASAQKAAAEKAAAEKAAAEKAAAERAAQRAAAEKAAAEKAAADKAAAEMALADQIAAEMAAALEADRASIPEPSVGRVAPPVLRPAARLDRGDEAASPGAVEPRLKEMAQRLDAALSRPTDEKLRLSLSDLLEDIEGTAADVSAPPAAPADRPRVPLATRRPAPPRAEPKSRAGLNPADYSRFLSEDPASAPSPAGSGEAAARTQARELFSDGWMRATRRLDRTDEPALKAPDVNVRPGRATAPPAAPTPREPLLTARRSDAAAPLDTASRRDPAPAVTKDAAPAPKPELDDPVAFLDEFDAEMATLLGRTPPR